MRRFIIYICSMVLLAGCGATRDKSIPGQAVKKDVRPAVEAVGSDKSPVEKEKPAPAIAETPRLTGQSVESKKTVQPVYERTDDQPAVEIISEGRQKKIFEFVTIDGDRYPVPSPWKGRKIRERPDMSALRQIPVAYTLNESKIFINEGALAAFLQMAQKAEKDDVNLVVHSGFRSRNYQQKIFSKLMAEGRTWQDLVRYVAPPGYSEHMLGYSLDLYPSNWKFASTEAYRWLKENGEAFGFSETYPQFGQEGFPWEAWHWCYSPSLKTAAKRSAGKERVLAGSEKKQ